MATEKQDSVLKANLRASHFTLGDQPVQYDSVNKEYGSFKHAPGGTSAQNSDMKKQLMNS